MNAPLGLKIFVVAVVLSVLLTVGYGIYVVGAPTTQRLVRLDQQRVSDLQNISFAISSYWDRNKELPPSLEALQGPQYFVQSIQDPETSQPYEYHILNEDTYELCATFKTNSTQNYEGPPQPFSERVWNHGIGRGCFQLQAGTSGDTSKGWNREKGYELDSKHLLWEEEHGNRIIELTSDSVPAS